MNHSKTNNNEQIILDEEPDILDSGSYPDKRSIEDLIDNCIIFIDKQIIVIQIFYQRIFFNKS